MMRFGFVSNSSSSSFLIAGIKYKLSDEQYEKWSNKEELPEEFKGLKGLCANDDFIIGKLLFDVSSDDGNIECGDLSILDIQEVIKKFPKEYQDKIKIYFGTREC